MNPKGAIVMSRRTYERFGAPKAVLVLFDPVNNRIGLKPAGPGTRNAHPVNVANTKTGSKIVRCYRLIVEARIDLPGTVEFPDADITDERILMLDLRTARPSRRALGRRAVNARAKSNTGVQSRVSREKQDGSIMVGFEVNSEDKRRNHINIDVAESWNSA